MTEQDKGWAWVILGASLGGNYLLGILVYFIGVIHVELLRRFQDDVTTTAWAGAIYSSLQMLGAPLATWIVHNYGCRVSVVTGGVFLCAGFAASGFVPSVVYLFFTYGFTAGTGMALTFIPLYMTVSFYFDRLRGLASGITVSAAAVGILSGSLITQALFDTFGLTGAFLMIAGISFHYSVFGMLMRPTKFEGKRLRRTRGLGKSEGTCENEERVLQQELKTLLEEGTFLKEPSDAPANHDATSSANATCHFEQTERTNNSDIFELSIPMSHREHALSGRVPADSVGCLKSNLGEDTDTCDVAIEKGRESAHAETEEKHAIETRNLLQKTNESDECNDKENEMDSLPLQNKKTRAASDERHNFDTVVEEFHEGHSGNSDDESHVKESYSISRKTTQEKHSLSKFSKALKAFLPLASNYAFVSHCFSVFFVNLTMSGVNLHLPAYTHTLGTSPIDAASLFIGVGVLSLVSRLLSGLLTTHNRVDPFYVSIALMGIGGLATTLFPLYSSTYAGQMVFACLYGLATGGFYTLMNVLTVELVGLRALAMAYGAEVFIMGVGYLAGSPVAGLLVDYGGTYDRSFTFLGLCMSVSCVMDIVAKVIQARAYKRSNQLFITGIALENKHHDSS